MKGDQTRRPGKRLLKSLETALECATTSTGLRDEGAHQARKSLKEARAALRLLRPVLGDAVYRKENRVLRDASRAISPLRDAKAQLDIFGALRQKYADSSPPSELAPLEARLPTLTRMRGDIGATTGGIQHAVRALRQSKRRLVRLTDRTFAPRDLETGLRSIYRQGRKGFAHARENAATTAMHEWRKHAKYFSNAVDVLGSRTRVDERAIAKDANRLAAWLGEDHDLAVLSRRLRRNQELISEHAAERLRTLIADRRHALQGRSLRLGAAVYTNNPHKGVK